MGWPWLLFDIWSSYKFESNGQGKSVVDINTGFLRLLINVWFDIRNTVI